MIVRGCHTWMSVTVFHWYSVTVRRYSERIKRKKKIIEVP